MTEDEFKMKVSIPTDDKGMTGRQCPECSGFFKLEFGTGIVEEDLKMQCPYCGHQDEPSEYLTEDQMEYLKSHALRACLQRLTPIMKSMERRPDPRAFLSIGIKVNINTPPVYDYEEPELETEVVCEGCTLHYSIYGVYGFCPDCGSKNALQIFRSNLILANKFQELVEKVEPEFHESLLASALATCVSAFDGFGREVQQRSTGGQNNGQRGHSFQNLAKVQDRMKQTHSVDIAEGIPSDKWAVAVCAFQKRHLLAHRSGVIDDAYIRESGDTGAIIGRKIQIYPEEISDVQEVLLLLAPRIQAALQRE
jgi:hypothetical protein